jgi:hypothetical protein
MPEPRGTWYSETVKNVTVSLPPEIYRRARMKAAERDTSLSALVRDFLMKLGDEETATERRKRLLDALIASQAPFSAENRLPRDKVYERRRRAVRRH